MILLPRRKSRSMRKFSPLRPLAPGKRGSLTLDRFGRFCSGFSRRPSEDLTGCFVHGDRNTVPQRRVLLLRTMAVHNPVWRLAITEKGCAQTSSITPLRRPRGCHHHRR